MISVVIPVFNKAHTIANTLSSVLVQTFQDFEVVIVNDGSTDNGMEVIKQLTTDPRISIIDQKNQGVSAARNKGVENAKFDYIAFLDGDDEWMPSYLAKMKEAIDLYPESGMFCSAGVYKEKKDEVLAYRLASKYKNKILPINYFENPHVFSHTSATIVKKETFYKCGGFMTGMGINEDFALFFSLALVSTVIYSGFPLSCYYGKVQGQLTSDISKEKDHLLGQINRINHTYSVWNEISSKNKLFIIFLKYEVRHHLIIQLRKNDYNKISLIYNTLDERIKNLFSQFEIDMISNKNLRRISIMSILLTKIIWRIHGFPRT